MKGGCLFSSCPPGVVRNYGSWGCKEKTTTATVFIGVGTGNVTNEDDWNRRVSDMVT